MDNNNHLEFITEQVTGFEESGKELVILLNPDDTGLIGNLYVVGPAKPEYEGGGLLLSVYKLNMNENGKLALIEQ